MNNKLANLLEQSLGEIWNERDDKKRMDAMKRLYTPDIIFYETDTTEKFKGFDEINERIIELFGQWPAGFAFHFETRAEINHDVIKISWTLGLTGEPPFITGMDIAVIENELIKKLYLFLDNNIAKRNK